MGSDGDDLARRLDRLEQIEAIKELKHRYWRASDAKDPEGFRRCFIASGARIDYGRLGSFDDAEPMATIFAQVARHRIVGGELDGEYAVLDMHHGMHPEITVLDEGHATGRWSLRFRQVNRMARTETVLLGDYDDEYVVENGEWKMSACRFTERWSITRPIVDDVQVSGNSFEDL